uniref:Arginine vasopressin-induced protein 1 n=1 Tax=Gouania willdenowi TaxID=441366 RepID=A0A8C5I0I2_GOUWI
MLLKQNNSQARVPPWMDTGPASPPSSVLAGPSSLWRLTDRRSRKTGSGNIFSDVNLWQLQKLFRAAGDQDAEQRAQLVWGHGDEAELAQALVGLRTRKFLKHQKNLQ